MRTRMLAAIMLSVMIAMLACTACLTIPTAGHVPLSAGTRGEIDADALRQIRPRFSRLFSVLEAFGEPDAVAGDGRWLVYRWIAVHGYFVVLGGGGASPLGSDYIDMVFEFDPTGLLVRVGELETLVAEGQGNDVPIDESEDLEAKVILGRHPARLVLTRDILRLEPDRADEEIQSYPVGRVHALLHDGDDDMGWWTRGYLSYILSTTDESGKTVAIKMQVDLFTVPRLARRLRAANPGFIVKD